MWPGYHLQLYWPWARSPLGWTATQDVTSGVPRVSKETCRLFVNVHQSGVKALSGGGGGKLPRGSGICSDVGRLRGRWFASQV